MNIWQIICGSDGALVAEVHGNYKIGDAPPAKSYVFKEGKAIYHLPSNMVKPELICTNPKHKGRVRPKWVKR